MEDPEIDTASIPKLRINKHGILGIFAIGVMVLVASLKMWRIPWFYFLMSVLLYASTVIPLSIKLEKPFTDADSQFTWFRIIVGSHISFFLLAIGMALGFDSDGINFTLFLACIAGGMTIPFILFRRR